MRSALACTLDLVRTLAAYPRMLENGRKREGLRVCRAAWLLGMTVREYRDTINGDRDFGIDPSLMCPPIGP